MADTFFASDLHLGHRNIVKYSRQQYESIQQHDEDLVQRWNSIVTEKDCVWVLGDVCFGLKAFETLGRLNGRKKLVLGNHDQYPVARYLGHFSKILGAAEFDGKVLTHIPVHHSQFHRYTHNIHGHLHARTLEESRYINVSMEQIGMQPIPYSELKRRHSL